MYSYDFLLFSFFLFSMCGGLISCLIVYLWSGKGVFDVTKKAGFDHDLGGWPADEDGWMDEWMDGWMDGWANRRQGGLGKSMYIQCGLTDSHLIKKIPPSKKFD